MRSFSVLVLAVLAFTSCQIPLGSLSSSKPGLTLTLAYTTAGSPRSAHGAPRLLLPNAGYAVVSLTDANGVVQTVSQSLSSQTSATFQFAKVLSGNTTILANAYSDTSSSVLLFTQKTTVNLTDGANQITLNLLPATFAPLTSGVPLPGSLAANATASFQYTLTNKADYVQLSGMPAGAAYFLQDSTGALVADVAGVVAPGATDGTLYLTLYNPAGASLTYSALSLVETSTAPSSVPSVPTTFTVWNVAAPPTGSLAAGATISFKFTLVSPASFVRLTGIPAGLTLLLQNSTGATVVDAVRNISPGATDGTLYLTFTNPTGSLITYTGMVLTETVTPIAVSTVFTSPSSSNLTIGGSNGMAMIHFTPSIPSNQAVNVSSSNPAVATVSPSGLVDAATTSTIIITPVGPGTANIIVTSVDGGHLCTISVAVSLHWTPQMATGLTITTNSSVAFGAGKFIAVGPGGAMMSTDGINWTSSPISASNWSSVAYGGTKFVAIAAGSSATAYSTDGITWISGAIPPTTSSWSSITYGSGLYLMTSLTPNSAYALDGSNWAGSVNLNAFSLTGLGAVAYGGGRFVGIDKGTALSTASGYSTDGVTWTLGGALPTIVYPPETATSVWGSIAYGNGMFFATIPEVGGTAGTHGAISTTGGVSWTAVNLPGGNWTSISFGNGQFILMSINGSVASTADGVIWSTATPGFAGSYSPVAYGNGKYVSVGTYSGVAYSLTSP